MSDKFTDTEIIKLLNALIGPTEAVGETNVDEAHLDNLKILIDVINWCLDGVLYASAAVTRTEKSMFDIGWTAKCALDEWRVWLEEMYEKD